MRIEAIEDIKNNGNRMIAKKGRQGELFDAYNELYGIGDDRKKSAYVSVLFDGNSIHREVPNWKLRRIKG